MMTASGSDRGMSPGDTSIHSELHSIFKHPAGLQTARALVESVVKHTLSRPGHPAGAPPATAAALSQALDVDDTSPEVDRILREILEFSDLQGRTDMEGLPEQRTTNAKGGLDGLNSLPRLAASSTSSSVMKSPQPHQALSQPVPLNSSSSYTPQAVSSETEFRSIFAPKITNSSLSHGTESPYRVESPGVRISPPTSIQPPAQRPLDRHFSQDRLKSDSRPDRTATLQPSNMATTSGDTSRISLPKSGDLIERIQNRVKNPAVGRMSSQKHQFPVDQNALLSLQASSIKSFLPVNKTTEHLKGQTIANSKGSDNPSATSSTYSSQLEAGTSHNSAASSIVPSPSAHPQMQLDVSPVVFDLIPPDDTDCEAEHLNKQSQKRKSKGSSAPALKKQKLDKSSKQKLLKPQPARHRISDDLWMRIFEFAPPQFLTKVRLVSRHFKTIVDKFDSIYINCRIENYGRDMPGPPKGLTERQYNDLFGGKGCLEPGCEDEKASRTHWSWYKRWCHTCWERKIIREDRAYRKFQNQYNRTTLTKMFECIPAGMHDSFRKPHDYTEDVEARTRQAPRLYKCYMLADVQDLMAKYEALSPPPYKEDPNHTAAEKSAALAAHQALMDALEGKRNDFFTSAKEANDEHMSRVQKIETAIRRKRMDTREPHDANRAARKELFSQRAAEDLPWIPSDFVSNTKAFKAATRIFRNAGTERGWQTLKPKIQNEWDDSQKADKQLPQQDAIVREPSSTDSEEDVAAKVEPTHTGAMPILFRHQNTGLPDVRRSVAVSQSQHFPSQQSFGSGLMVTNPSVGRFNPLLGYGTVLSSTTSGQSAFPTASRRVAAPGLNGFATSESFGNPGPGNNSNAFPGLNSRATQFSQHMGHNSSSHANSSHFHGTSYQNPRHISIDSLLTGPARAPAPQYRNNHFHNPFE